MHALLHQLQSPKRQLWFLSLTEVERRLGESVSWGVKEYYFTGGEPFSTANLVPMLERTLEFGPATVLTNATVHAQARMAGPPACGRGTQFVQPRVPSFGGWPNAAANDLIRGPGAFDRALEGIRLLAAHDFLPIVTLTRFWESSEDEAMLGEFRELLQRAGCDPAASQKCSPSQNRGRGAAGRRLRRR